MPSYVITCCDRPIARIDDDRPTGLLSIESDSKQAVIGGAPTIDDEQASETPQNVVMQTWADAAVSETLWGNGVLTWVIRCRECGKQAEMGDANFSLIADALITGAQHEIPLGVLCNTLRRLKG